jgi:hypothetical protein
MNTYGRDEDSFTYGEVKVVRETGKAILVLNDDNEEFWVPKTCLSEDSEVWKDKQEGQLVVKQSWAEHEDWV